MKWIPKGCEISNDKNKSNGPTFVKGPTESMLCTSPSLFKSQKKLIDHKQMTH